MEKRRLGRTDIEVTALCLGTMMYGEQIGEAHAFEQMDYAVEKGINFFDTSEIYTIPPKPETQGESERIVGRWMKDRGARDKIILATKVAGRSPVITWLRNNEGTRVTRAAIEHAVNGSLARLQTDYIDLYQIHWPDRRMQLFGGNLEGYKHSDDAFADFRETLEVFEDLRKAGKVRHFGLSNESPWGVMRFLEEATQHDLPRMASIQNAYNVANRVFEYGLSEITMREDVGLLAYSPLGQGVLTGKYLDGARPAGSREVLFSRLERYQTPGAETAVRSYIDVAKSFDIDITHLLMQFVTTRPWVTSNLFGATSMDQLRVLLSSIDTPWTEEMEAAVNAVHARLPNPCP